MNLFHEHIVLMRKYVNIQAIPKFNQGNDSTPPLPASNLGPISVHQWNASWKEFRWRVDDGLLVYANYD